MFKFRNAKKNGDKKRGDKLGNERLGGEIRINYGEVTQYLRLQVCIDVNLNDGSNSINHNRHIINYKQAVHYVLTELILFSREIIN